jgi:hypothetical protein
MDSRGPMAGIATIGTNAITTITISVEEIPTS